MLTSCNQKFRPNGSVVLAAVEGRWIAHPVDGELVPADGEWPAGPGARSVKLFTFSVRM